MLWQGNLLPIQCEVFLMDNLKAVGFVYLFVTLVIEFNSFDE